MKRTFAEEVRDLARPTQFYPDDGDHPRKAAEEIEGNMMYLGMDDSIYELANRIDQATIAGWRGSEEELKMILGHSARAMFKSDIEEGILDEDQHWLFWESHYMRLADACLTAQLVRAAFDVPEKDLVESRFRTACWKLAEVFTTVGVWCHDLGDRWAKRLLERSK